MPKRLPIACASLALVPLIVANDIDYSRDILPILSGNCFECHGPDAETREADLRLDQADSAYADRDGATAIVPGDPEASDLIFLINSDVEDERMPPPNSKKSLTEAEKETLAKWISQGGVYEKHWGFQVPEKEPVPSIASHPIDSFIRDRLSQEGIKPSSPASANTLVRRLHLDLIGLPPSPDEVTAFVASHRKIRKRQDARAMGLPGLGGQSP
jgi:hypothetical protein